MNDEIREGLQAAQKKLPAALLYDDLGSTLFEAITRLPEYGVARADETLLPTHIDTCVQSFSQAIDVIELGPGHGRKAKVVLASVLRHQPSARFFAIDVSGEALRACKRTLDEVPHVATTLIEGSFIDGLRQLPARDSMRRRLVLFLGSNLSNFDRHESSRFFCDVRATMHEGDALLLSADLEKPVDQLLPAYDDSLGVTAAFAKNALGRLNREFRADFELQNFAYDCRWNSELRRIEMHLRAKDACVVHLVDLELQVPFSKDETVLVESSHRFNVAELEAFGRRAQFEKKLTFVHASWPLALSLFVAT